MATSSIKKPNKAFPYKELTCCKPVVITTQNLKKHPSNILKFLWLFDIVHHVLMI